MKARPLQEFFLGEIIKAGGYAFVGTDVDEMRESLRSIVNYMRPGLFVAIELKNEGRYVNESSLKKQTVAMIRREFPKAWIYKTSDRFTSGIPDLIICLG
jgi:hypothetical protein